MTDLRASNATPPADDPSRGSKESTPGRPRLWPQPWWLVVLVLLTANYVLTRVFFPQSTAISVPYTFFKHQVAAGNVEAITSSGDSIEGKFKTEVMYPPKESQGPSANAADQPKSRTSMGFKTRRPIFADPGLEVHTKNVPLAPDVSLERIAAETPGLVGAELRNLVNEAALLAARKDESSVSAEDFSEAMQKITLGPARNILLNPADRERTAYHEAGHALLALLVPGSDPAHRVSIVPRGMALGATYQLPVDDRTSSPKITCARASPAPSAAARPRSWSMAWSRRAPRTTSSKSPRSPVTWCCAGG
jgi:hypothetical protein